MSSESRSSNTNPLGKLTAEIPKVKVSEETKEILEAEGRKVGMTLTEFARSVLELRAHGFDMVARLQSERLRVVAGMGEQSVGHAGKD